MQQVQAYKVGDKLFLTQQEAEAYQEQLNWSAIKEEINTIVKNILTTNVTLPNDYHEFWESHNTGYKTHLELLQHLFVNYYEQILDIVSNINLLKNPPNEQ